MVKRMTKKKRVCITKPEKVEADKTATRPNVLRIDPSEKYHHDVQLQFQDMRDKDVFTDVILKLKDNEEIQAHKIILASHSPFLKQLLSSGHDEVRLHFLNSQALIKLVEYFYSGHLEIGMEEAQDIMEAVDHLEVTHLHNKISQYVVDNLTPDNCISWYLFADECSMAAIHLGTRKIMSKEFNSVVHTNAFLDLGASHVKSYLAAGQSDHDTTLDASFRWITHNTPERKQELDDLLGNIDLHKCSLSVLKHVVDRHGDELITEFHLLKKFNSAMLYHIPSWVPQNNKAVRITGGHCLGEVNLCSWEIDIVTGTAIEQEHMPKSISSTICSAMCATPQGALFAGGAPNQDALSATTQCIEFNTRQKCWSVLPDLLEPAFGSSAVCSSGKVFLLGGWGERNNKMDCLDLETKKWCRCPDMPNGQITPIVVAIKNRLFVLSTTNKANVMPAFMVHLQSYDITTSTWSVHSIPPRIMQANTCGASAVALAGSMYVIGGYLQCVRYDPATDTWTVLEPPNKQHVMGSACVHGSDIILSGGLDKGQISKHIERYDPASNKWELLSITLPVPLWHHIMIT